jgi:Uma2 family endonuclease
LPGVINFQPEPDVVVAPGTASYELYAEDFRLVAEVLSPSNTRPGIDLKLRRYREAPGNLYVVIIEPREILVEVYAKTRNWEPVILRQGNNLVEMPEFDLRFSVDELYRGTPLDPQRRAG